jgi:hypothetical protein
MKSSSNSLLSLSLRSCSYVGVRKSEKKIQKFTAIENIFKD